MLSSLEVTIEWAYPHTNRTICQFFGPKAKVTFRIRRPFYHAFNSRDIATPNLWHTERQCLDWTGARALCADVTKRLYSFRFGWVK